MARGKYKQKKMNAETRPMREAFAVAEEKLQTAKRSRAKDRLEKIAEAEKNIAGLKAKFNVW